jgi:hypothetical protein
MSLVLQDNADLSNVTGNGYILSDACVDDKLIQQSKRKKPNSFELGCRIVCEEGYYDRIALIPGNSMPSKYSSMAPPPVET